MNEVIGSYQIEWEGESIQQESIESNSVDFPISPSEELLKAGFPNVEYYLDKNAKPSKYGMDTNQFLNLAESFNNPFYVYVDEHHPDILKSIILLHDNEASYRPFIVSCSRVGNDGKIQDIKPLTDRMQQRLLNNKSVEYSCLYYNKNMKNEISDFMPIKRINPSPYTIIPDSVEQGRIVQGVYALSREFNLPCDVTLIRNSYLESIPNGKNLSDAYGWYENSTDKVFINIEKCKTKEIACKTMFHECVGHYGLRLMLGSRFNGMMDHIYENSVWQIRKGIDDYIKVRLSDDAHKDMDEKSKKILGTEEYLSSLAEKTDFCLKDDSLLKSILSSVEDSFHHIKLMLPFSVTEKDLSWLLMKSHESLLRRSLFGRIVDRLPRNRFTNGIHEKAAKHTIHMRCLSKDMSFLSRHSFIRILRDIVISLGFPLGTGFAYVIYDEYRRHDEKKVYESLGKGKNGGRNKSNQKSDYDVMSNIVNKKEPNINYVSEENTVADVSNIKEIISELSAKGVDVNNPEICQRIKLHKSITVNAGNDRRVYSFQKGDDGKYGIRGKSYANNHINNTKSGEIVH